MALTTWLIFSTIHKRVPFYRAKCSAAQLCCVQYEMIQEYFLWKHRMMIRLRYCKSSLDFEVSNSSDDNINTASLPPSASSLFSDFSFANMDRMVTHRISTQSTHSKRCSTGTKPYVIRWAKGHNFQPACKSQGQHFSKDNSYSHHTQTCFQDEGNA